MAEQVIANIERPAVGIDYVSPSQEAGITDRLAACELALHALAQHVRDIRVGLGLPCPREVFDLAASDSWRLGM